MRRLLLFAAGVVVQASFGVLALIVTRWGFRSWPTGSYTWIPALVGVAGFLVLLLLGRLLGARGLPFPLLAVAWYCGRIAGALASALVTHDGIDSSLVATASFGLVLPEPGRMVLGTPSVLPAAAQLTVLGLAYLWGKGSRRSTSTPGQP